MAEDTGGTTSNLCEISPSDLAGMVGNLVNRVVSLEQRVSELSAQDVSANQLSDLSQDAGWITGVTFLGEEGWTQTPSGTLIPPTGWTGLSSIIDGGSGITFYGAGGKNIIGRIINAETVTNGSTVYIGYPSSSSFNIDINSSAYFRFPSTVASGDPDTTEAIDILQDGAYRLILTLGGSYASSPTTPAALTVRRNKTGSWQLYGTTFYLNPITVGSSYVFYQSIVMDLTNNTADSSFTIRIANGSGVSLTYNNWYVSMEFLG